MIGLGNPFFYLKNFGGKTNFGPNNLLVMIIARYFDSKWLWRIVGDKINNHPTQYAVRETLD